MFCSQITYVRSELVVLSVALALAEAARPSVTLTHE